MFQHTRFLHSISIKQYVVIADSRWRCGDGFSCNTGKEEESVDNQQRGFAEFAGECVCVCMCVCICV